MGTSGRDLREAEVRPPRPGAPGPRRGVVQYRTEAARSSVRAGIRAGGTLKARFVIAVAVVGLLLNLTGWAGNVFLLGPMWDRAVILAPPPMRSPFGGVVHVLLQFFSDFVFAFVWCLVYRLASPGWNRPGLKLA